MKTAHRADRNWYVLCTKSRQEKKIAEFLISEGYSVFCPLQKVFRKWSDRTKAIEEPLFNGFVFIQIEEQKRDEVFAYPGILRYLFWMRRPAIVRDEEIATIQKWLGNYQHERLQVSDIIPGTYVRITSGKFMNEEGILIDVSNSKALVQIKELGIQISLDLTQNELQALQRHSKM